MRELIQQLEEGAPIAGAGARELEALAAPLAAKMAAAAEAAFDDGQDVFEDAVLERANVDITTAAAEREMDRAYVALRRAFVKALPPMLKHGLTAR